MDQRVEEIIAECKRQEMSCLYTSTALFEWLKVVRVFRVAFIIVPIIAGTIASAKILLKDSSFEWFTAICALLAGLFPAIFKGLNLDVSQKSISDSANRFKTLQDRFRQTAHISVTKSVDELEVEFNNLMDRMDSARSTNLAIPERYFSIAKEKIERGDYSFDEKEVKNERSA